MHSHGLTNGPGATLVAVVVLLSAVLAYVGPAVANRRRRPWPVYRSLLWTAGWTAVAVVLLRPSLGTPPTFVQHTVDHLLIGMIAPLLLAASAPVTLALRSLHPVPARRLARLLRSPPLRIVSHPVTALVLNTGGLWAVYTTGVYAGMHNNAVLLLLVHVHFLAAGYLFTAAVIGIDPTPYRRRFVYRSVVLGIALASHGILSKYLYGHPPIGVPAAQAEQGSMLMYYAGDAVDVVLVLVLCAQWFRATRPDRGSRRTHFAARPGSRPA